MFTSESFTELELSARFGGREAQIVRFPHIQSLKSSGYCPAPMARIGGLERRLRSACTKLGYDWQEIDFASTKSDNHGIALTDTLAAYLRGTNRKLYQDPKTQELSSLLQERILTPKQEKFLNQFPSQLRDRLGMPALETLETLIHHHAAAFLSGENQLIPPLEDLIRLALHGNFPVGRNQARSLVVVVSNT